MILTLHPPTVPIQNLGDLPHGSGSSQTLDADQYSSIQPQDSDTSQGTVPGLYSSVASLNRFVSIVIIIIYIYNG